MAPKLPGMELEPSTLRNSRSPPVRRGAYLDDLVIDRKSGEGLMQQLARQIRMLILTRTIASGTKLASSRALSESLGLARNTVADAYALLVAEGWAQTRSGAGTFAFLSDEHDSPRQPLGTPIASPSQRGSKLLRRAGASLGQGGSRLLAPGIPALDRFPIEAWNRSMLRGNRQASRALLSGEDPRGWRPLREAIAAHLGPARGLVCDPDQIVILTSARQGIHVAALALSNPGDLAWVEEPGYPEARSALLSADVTPVSVPVDDEGLNVFEAYLRCPNARFAVVTPAHQYPLGSVLSAKRRYSLLEWARVAGAFVVEDDYDGEFRGSGAAISALAATDRHDRVIYVGTFSKTLFPALRLAYLVAPPRLADVLAQTRALLDAHTSVIPQAGLADFIASGNYANHLRNMRALYADRRRSLSENVRLQLSGKARLRASKSGLHAVADFRSGIDDAVVADALDRGRYRPAPLSMYYASTALPPQGLVLGFAGNTVEEIAEAVTAIGAAIPDVAPSSP